MNRLLRVAYCVVPAIGGTHTFYRNLSRASLPYGIRVYSTAIGRDECSRWDDTFATDDCVRIAPDEADTMKAAQAFVDWCARMEIHVVLPMCGRVACSSVPHLPDDVRIVMRGTNVTRHAYDLVCLHPEHTEMTVATSPHMLDHMRRRRRLPRNRLGLVRNGVDVALFETPRTPPPSSHLRLGFVGRLEAHSKGVMYLPRILHRLRRDDIPYSMTIVGGGPDRERLEKALNRSMPDARVTFTGPLGAADARKALSTIDVFLMPSIFEGCPNMLLEAMAAGCFPIVSHLKGITDDIVEPGRTGRLCPVGDHRAFANAAASVWRSPPDWSKLQSRVRDAVDRKFHVDTMARAYAAVFRNAVQRPRLTRRARDWSAFRVDPIFMPSWRRHVPQSVKTSVRTLLTR